MNEIISVLSLIIFSLLAYYITVKYFYKLMKMIHAAINYDDKYWEEVKKEAKKLNGGDKDE